MRYKYYILDDELFKHDYPNDIIYKYHLGKWYVIVNYLLTDFNKRAKSITESEADDMINKFKMLQELQK